MEVFVGTSGWSHGWNSGGNLDLYLNTPCLDAVELNASFYRFPYKNQVAGRARKGANILWCVKVHRSVTQLHRFSGTVRDIWQRFLDLFSCLDPSVDWYLFKAPPSMTDIIRILDFFKDLLLPDKCILEIRNRNPLLDDTACRRLQDCISLMSVDSPGTRNRIFSGEIISMRMHGREDWYRHDYTQEELKGTAGMIRSTGAGKVYLFFNHDHSILENAQIMIELLRRDKGGSQFRT